MQILTGCVTKVNKFTPLELWYILINDPSLNSADFCNAPQTYNSLLLHSSGNGYPEV